MNKVTEIIKNADNRTLWKLLSDTAGVLDGCALSRNDARVMFWYWIFKAIQSQIDSNMSTDYDGGLTDEKK